jgi:hypothetical protein
MTTELNKQSLQNAYLSMRRIREFEERVHVEFATGEIPGFVHLYAGEEASATGVIMHLRNQDYLASTHRGHGHCIAKGLNVRTMMAEIYGKKPGICGGKGGSMHVADLHLGMMGANGIVGGGGPLVCGAALAAKIKHTDNVRCGGSRQFLWPKTTAMPSQPRRAGRSQPEILRIEPRRLTCRAQSLMAMIFSPFTRQPAKPLAAPEPGVGLR